MGSAAKPFAALSAGLLARKGEARPAMRPQLLDPAASLDDLGWNDMGDAAPPVLAERQALAASLVAPPIPPFPTLSDAATRRIGEESARQAGAGKAAFTLRLDAGRHLRLRLASALSNRSAQALVADALDRFLQSMPEVEALAAQLPSQEPRP